MSKSSGELALVSAEANGQRAVVLAVPHEQLNIVLERFRAAEFAALRYRDAVQIVLAGHGYTDGTLASIDTDTHVLNVLVPERAHGG